MVNRFDCGTHFDGGVMIDSEDGEFVEYKVHAEMEARCAALAAENAALNNKIDKLATWLGIEFYSSVWAFNNNDGDAALEFMCDTETPATDAFLAEVRAQGVEMLADAYDARSKESTHYMIINHCKIKSEQARDFAAQLRQEAK